MRAYTGGTLFTGTTRQRVCALLPGGQTNSPASSLQRARCAHPTHQTPQGQLKGGPVAGVHTLPHAGPQTHVAPSSTCRAAGTRPCNVTSTCVHTCSSSTTTSALARARPDKLQPRVHAWTGPAERPTSPIRFPPPSISLAQATNTCVQQHSHLAIAQTHYKRKRPHTTCSGSGRHQLAATNTPVNLKKALP